MFEKEIKFIGDFCFNQVKSLGSNFTLDKITNAGVHPAVVQYISAELDFMIYSDRRKLLQQSYFDYAGKEIFEHFQKISDEIKKHKKISLDDSKKLIFQAVSFNINYLVRPRWSLMKLIFNDQPVISVEEMKMLLNYLYYYEYFKKVLKGYISKRNLVQISSTEFDILLNKIDNELLNSDQHQVISNSFTSMGDFFNVGGADKNRLPITAVEIFCKEKNLVDLLLKLKKAIPNEVKRRYDKVEIERILFAPGSLPASDIESDLEDESKTEKMIEALDSDDSETIVSESEEVVAAEAEKPESDAFLSPEEEEALLSIYSEESKGESKNEEDPTITSTLDIKPEEFKDLDVDGVKTALDMNLNTEPESNHFVEHNQDEITTFIETTEEKSEFEKPENQDDASTDEIFDSEKELDGIVNAISDDLSSDEVEIEEDILVDNFESEETFESEVEIETEQENSEEIKPDIENEIVQEMIDDYYSEDSQDESEKDVNEAEEEELAENETESEVEKAEEKISSMEDDLLNIFQGLDNEEFKFPEKERFSVDEKENTASEEVELLKEEDTFSSETTDGFDDYLKSIDEIVFTNNPVKSVVEKNPVEEKFEVEELSVQKEIEIEEPPAIPAPTPVKNEKPIDNSRNLRSKDLFSYLRRKEVKKIVAYIFANDEEDFTNTAERIMDCNSYKEASDILKAVFTSYKISPYSKEAITFTNSVSNYFRQA